MITVSSRYGLLIGIAVIAALSGCHSAFFQTAKTRNGLDVSGGVTKVQAADQPDVSDYSIFVRGEIGRAASKSSFGYSFALTFISPFENRYRDQSIGGDYWDEGIFPNEAAGVLPEFKLQFPRKIPVDLALDLRFMAVYPERIALLASEDLTDWLTLYQACTATSSEGVVLCLGGQVELTRRLSVLIERTQWLTEHNYPDDYSGPVRTYPYSFGIAVCYHIPRKTKQHDSRDYAQTN